MKKGIVSVLGMAMCFGISTTCYGAQTIVAKKVARAPIIDGSGADAVWAQAQEFTTYDEVAKINMTLRAVYTDSEIFFLISYPDSDESITHKTWVWDKTAEMYKTGLDREDTFVFKWSMEPGPVALSLRTDNAYIADIWFWKACRTNPVGYVDDKYQHFSANAMPKSNKLTSGTGKSMYLIRRGDSGTAAYRDTLYEDYKGDKMTRYTNPTPTGSRADIRAKGVWSAGSWTIEFARALNTGNADDIQFDTSKSYLFGVSRYEIAGKPANPKLEQPLYGSGDVGEALTLQFGE